MDKIPEHIRAGLFSDDDVRRMPAEIYKRPCGKCPSTKGDDDEAREIRTWHRDAQLGMLFVCAWRRKKLCKGLCDKGGFSEDEVKDFKRRYVGEG